MSSANPDPAIPRVLVTGGTGLVGRAIADAIASDPSGAEWKFLGSKDADLMKYDECLAAFTAFRPTHIIHLAAQVGGLFKNMARKFDMANDNFIINSNVLNAASALRVQRVVSMTSTCVFPDKTEYPIKESYLHLGPPHSSNEGYAYAKRMLEVLSRLHNEQHGTNWCTVCPTNIYGPYDNYSLQDSHVLPGLLHKAYISSTSSTPFIVWGSGKPVRQFIFSRDLARIIVWRTLHDSSTEAMIATPGGMDCEVSIESIAREVAALAGVTHLLEFDTSKADGQFRKPASCDVLMSKLPAGFAFTPFSEGLKESWEWFKSNYDTCRK